MKPNQAWIKIPSILMIVGLIPFFLLNYFLFIGNDIEIPFGGISKIQKVYCFFIAVFMCGVLWGISVSKQVKNEYELKKSNILFTLSIIFSLLMAISYILFADMIFFIISSFIFCFLLACDFYLYREQRIDFGYLKLRFVVTIFVILSLIFSQLII